MRISQLRGKQEAVGVQAAVRRQGQEQAAREQHSSARHRKAVPCAAQQDSQANDREKG